MFNLPIVKEFIQKAKSIKANAVRIILGISREFVSDQNFWLTNTLTCAAGERNGMVKDLYYIDEKGKKTTMSLNMEHCPPFCGSTTKVEGTPYDEEVKTYTAGSFIDQDYAEVFEKELSRAKAFLQQ